MLGEQCVTWRERTEGPQTCHFLSFGEFSPFEPLGATLKQNKTAISRNYLLQ